MRWMHQDRALHSPGYTTVMFASPQAVQGVSWLALPLGLARRAQRFDPRCIRFEMENAMTWRPKHLFQKRPEVVVVTINLRRIRWIEPIAGSGHWWPFPLPRRR
jgi:hypothetical protein